MKMNIIKDYVKLNISNKGTFNIGFFHDASNELDEQCK